MTSIASGAHSANSEAANTIGATVSNPDTRSPVSRVEWEAALDAFENAQLEVLAFDEEWRAVNDAYEAGRPSMDMIQWSEFPYTNHNIVAHTKDLEKAWQHFLDGEDKWWFSPTPEERKAKFRAALDSVQAYRDALAAHNHETGMDAADEQMEALAAREAELERGAMQMPAPDRAALLWKLEILLKPDEDDEDGALSSYRFSYYSQTVADMRRLLGGEA